MIERHALDLTNMSAWDYLGNYECWPLDYVMHMKHTNFEGGKIPPLLALCRKKPDSGCHYAKGAKERPAGICLFIVLTAQPMTINTAML